MFYEVLFHLNIVNMDKTTFLQQKKGFGEPWGHSTASEERPHHLCTDSHSK